MRSDIGTFRDLGIDTVASLTPSVQSDASAAIARLGRAFHGLMILS